MTETPETQPEQSILLVFMKPELDRLVSIINANVTLKNIDGDVWDEMLSAIQTAFNRATEHIKALQPNKEPMAETTKVDCPETCSEECKKECEAKGECPKECTEEKAE